MYTFPNKLRNLAFTSMILGFLGLAYGFLAAPSTIEESKSMLISDHHGGHSESNSAHHEEISGHNTSNLDSVEKTEYSSENSHGNSQDHHESGSHDSEHDEHVFHQLSNKPWAAFYVAAFFFFMISLGTLAFYAIQRAAQAGWSPVLYRVMEGITAYLLPGGIIVITLLVLSAMHLNHLFIWMDPEVVAHDKLIAGKTGFLILGPKKLSKRVPEIVAKSLKICFRTIMCRLCAKMVTRGDKVDAPGCQNGPQGCS